MAECEKNRGRARSIKKRDRRKEVQGRTNKVLHWSSPGEIRTRRAPFLLQRRVRASPAVPLASLETGLFDSARFSFFPSRSLPSTPFVFFPLPPLLLDFSLVLSSWLLWSLRFLFFALAFHSFSVLRPRAPVIVFSPLFFNSHSSLRFSPPSRSLNALYFLLFALISVFPPFFFFFLPFDPTDASRRFRFLLFPSIVISPLPNSNSLCFL